MSVHPVCQKMLDMIAERPPIGDGEDPLALMRASAEARASAKLGPDVMFDAVVDERVMVRDGHEVPVRIYTPPNSGDGLLPVIVYYHGGGWISGSLGTHHTTCEHLAVDTGYKVVSVDYRLAPEHKFPLGLQDCCDVTEWVAMMGPSLGVDRNKIVVGGDSAGGNLAAAVAIWARDYDGPKIAFQLLIYPVIDSVKISQSRQEFSEGFFLEQVGMNWCTEHYVNAPEERSMWQVSPIYVDSCAGLPPAHVITAGYDILKDEGKAYADALSEAGVPTTYVEYRDVIHGFLGFGNALSPAREASMLAGEEMKRVLG
jgi:acetyl esterase/lipase